MTIPRRSLLAGAAAALALAPLQGRAAPPVPRVVALEWGLAGLSMALGVTPVGVAELGPYADWVAEPAMPPEVPDIGLRLQPNLAFVRALKPDYILATPQFAALLPLMEGIGAPLSYSSFDARGAPLAANRENAVALAAKLGRAEAGAALVAQADALFARMARGRGDGASRPVLPISFADGRHLRVFGKGSLYCDVLAAIGLEGAWRDPVNFWGFANARVEDLAAYPDAMVLVVGPVPATARQAMAGDGLWAHLPFARAGRLRVIDAVWAYGELPAAMRFAQLAGEALS
ncbi:iron-siderophore ABC transporter substrate-binding protein [Paroceanicella profunda]|uniref:Iron-siderophore ABC transporter substrate-binding protein n=1 Tax=Paroceanicella profunda TaxID=2579971 RepID=A0A5B8FYF1_9RHOB|nr:ABC transporter substrate-binding protein [Paroceanicella profunda]QDL91193.1 iron-siderophore ABC transporter substrate-binding protein [Paroceanicella profunda]